MVYPPGTGHAHIQDGIKRSPVVCPRPSGPCGSGQVSPYHVPLRICNFLELHDLSWKGFVPDGSEDRQRMADLSVLGSAQCPIKTGKISNFSNSVIRALHNSSLIFFLSYLGLVHNLFCTKISVKDFC